MSPSQKSFPISQSSPAPRPAVSLLPSAGLRARKMLGALCLGALVAACGGGGSDAPIAPPAASASAPVPVPAPLSADLRAGGQAVVARVLEGKPVQYAMWVTNAGPDAGQNVAVAVSVAGGQSLTTVVCAAAGGAVCPSVLATAMIAPTIPKDGTLVFTLTASSPVIGTDTTLSASLSTQLGVDPVATNNVASASASSIARNHIRLESDPGDYIGAGRSYAYNQTNARLAFSSPTPNGLTVNIQGDQDWSGEFRLPQRADQLQNGGYNNLARFPFHDAAVGGLSWTGQGRGCNTLTGSFTLSGVRYEGGRLDAFDLTFTHFCEGGTAALRGQMHWSSLDDTAPAPPAAQAPAGLWAPSAGATPETGNYVHLQSDPSDFIGAGEIRNYTTASHSLSAMSNDNTLRVSVGNVNDNWTGSFAGMSNLQLLQPGFYGDLRRFPFHNGTKGGLSWSGNGRNCNELNGWFMVDSITYSGGELTSVELRFEQRCDGSLAALRGKIKWTR